MAEHRLKVCERRIRGCFLKIFTSFRTGGNENLQKIINKKSHLGGWACRSQREEIINQPMAELVEAILREKFFV